MDEIFPDKRNPIGLVEQASEGKLCLPEFQRDFVWTRNEVADLIRSVLRGYYIGSLLLLRGDPNRPPFEPVVLRGARPMLRQPRPEWLVLDGQQRLTSLLYALTAPDLPLKDSSQPRRFFINGRRWRVPLASAGLALGALAGCAPLPPPETADGTVGLASWYGAPHHGRRTASGQPFDMRQMVAAHRTLPFGTPVRVVNLENGRSVVVRIVDRGPHVRGRIIDLSHAAADALGMVDRGVVRVRLEVLPP